MLDRQPDTQGLADPSGGREGVVKRHGHGDVLVTVVEGEEQVVWRQIEDLAAAGPDDAVFVLSPDSGAIFFGDGEHGRQPADGAQVRVSFFNGKRLKASEFTLEQTYRRVRGPRSPAGKIKQVIPAGGWSAVERAPDGERLVPLTGWALLDPYVPLYRNGNEPAPEPTEQSVRGLVVGPSGTVQVVDEQATSFVGYRL